MTDSIATVRTAVFPRDTAIVARLVAAYLRQTESEKVERGLAAADTPLPDRYAREIADPGIAFRNRFVLIASVDGEDCGMVVVTESATVTEVSRLWTTPSARGRGVAAALISAVLDRAGAPVRLSVWEWRADAIRLYRRLGFVPVPSWDDREKLLCLERR